MRSVEATHFLLATQFKDIADKRPVTFPFTLPSVQNLEDVDFHPAVTFFVGENGSGKSTVLEALAILMGCNPEGGSGNFGFSTNKAHVDLHEALRPVRSTKKPRTKFFLRAESYFNVATAIDKLDEDPLGGPRIIESYGGRSLHKQSHGESFMALLMNRFCGDGLYFLDEPEAALSPTRQMAMIARMNDLVEQGSQFIVATHSPILLSYPNARIYQFDEKGIHNTPYQETEHYKVTRDFLLNHEARLKILLTPDS